MPDPLPPVSWTWGTAGTDAIGQDFCSQSVLYSARATIESALLEREHALQSSGLPSVIGGYAMSSWSHLQTRAMQMSFLFVKVDGSGIPTWQLATGNIQNQFNNIFAAQTIKSPGASDVYNPWPGSNGLQRRCPREICRTDTPYWKGASIALPTPSSSTTPTIPGKPITTAFATAAQEGDVARLVVTLSAQAAVSTTTPPIPAVAATAASDKPSAGSYYTFHNGAWTPWAAQPNGQPAALQAVVSDYGSYQVGDYIGSWFINDLVTLLNQYTATAVGSAYLNGNSSVATNLGIYGLSGTTQAITGTYQQASNTYAQSEAVADRYYGRNDNSPSNDSTDPYRWSGTVQQYTCPAINGFGSSNSVAGYIKGAYKTAGWTQLGCRFQDPTITGSNYLTRTVSYYVVADVFHANSYPQYELYSCPYGYPQKQPYLLGSGTGSCSFISGPVLGGPTCPSWPANNPYYNEWLAWQVMGIVQWQFAYSSSSSGPVPAGSPCTDTTLGICGKAPTPVSCPSFAFSSCCFELDFNISSNDTTLAGDHYCNQNSNGYSGTNVAVVWVPVGQCGGYWQATISPTSGSSSSPIVYMSAMNSNATGQTCPPTTAAGWTYVSGPTSQTLTVSCSTTVRATAAEPMTTEPATAPQSCRGCGQRPGADWTPRRVR